MNDDKTIIVICGPNRIHQAIIHCLENNIKIPTIEIEDPVLNIDYDNIMLIKKEKRP